MTATEHDAARSPDIARYIEHLKHERQYSAHTLDGLSPRSRRHSLRRSTSSAGKPCVRRTFATTSSALHRRGAATRSIQRALSCIRSFLDYLGRIGAVDANVASVVRAPKSRRKLPKLLDTDQTAQLLNFDAESTLDLRDAAMMELFYGSGLRLAELVALDVERPRSRRRFRHGHRQRSQGTSGAAGLVLHTRAAQLSRATRHSATPSDPVFCARGNSRIGRRTVQQRSAVAERAAARNERRASTHAAAQFCEPPARVERRSARGAGTARTHRHLDDADLHAPRLPAPREGLRREPSAREAFLRCRASTSSRSISTTRCGTSMR